MLLEIRDLSVHYHKVAALKGVSVAVPEGGIVTIIGANGAGKSTILRTISGLTRASNGEIRFAGERIDTLPAEKIVARGIAHVPEGRRVFPGLTVEENLRTGAFLRRDKPAIESDLGDVFGHFPRLKERRRQWARTLSGGEQQMLAIGRALMTDPVLLALGEPSLGLAPLIIDRIYEVIAKLRDEMKMTVLLVEQNAQRALNIADYALSWRPGASCSMAPRRSSRRTRTCRNSLGGWSSLLATDSKNARGSQRSGCRGKPISRSSSIPALPMSSTRLPKSLAKSTGITWSTMKRRRRTPKSMLTPSWPNG